LACDALALAIIGAEKKREYGGTILRLLEASPRVSGVPAMVGILEDKRQLRERISMIAAFDPKQRWPVLAVLLVTILGVAGLTDARRIIQAAVANHGTPPILEEPETPAMGVTNGPTVKVIVTNEEG